jgi:hypothetical protein
MIRATVSLVLLLLVVAGAALVVLGPNRLAEYMPNPLADLVLDYGERLGLQGLIGSEPRASTPDALLSDTPEGLVALGPIAALPGNAPVFIKSVLAGHTSRVSRAIPAEITTIRPILGCRLTAPIAGTLVGEVTAGSSDQPLALSTYNDSDLARGVAAFVETYRKSATVEVELPDSLAYQATDVAVTETRAPVFLVLENRQGNRIWNIHLAPGARVERVVLLGGAQAGVANLDPVVPVEVLLNDGLATCGIAPAHPLNRGHALLQPQGEGGRSPADQAAELARIEAAAAAYDQWFRDSFGVSTRDRAGFDRGAVAVVGPVPEAEAGRAVYAPIGGADIRTTHDSYFEIRGQVPEGEDFAARVTAIATGFAFGDLATLRQGIDF